MHLKILMKVVNNTMSQYENLAMIEALMVKGIEYFLSKHSNKVIDAAKEDYLKGVDGDYKEYGFDNWFLTDYVHEGRDMMTLFIQNQGLTSEERETIKSIQGSWFSYFEVFEIEGKSLLKDLFTKEDFKVENSELLGDGSIVAARLYPVGNDYYIEILEHFDGDMQQHVTGAVLAKYNEYCVQNETVDIGMFIKNASLLLYKFMTVFRNVSFQESDDGEEYAVYQSDYVFENRDKVIEILSTEGSFEFVDEEDGAEIYSFSHEGAIVELVIGQNKIEIEAPSEASRKEIKSKVESLLEGYISFVQDIILNIDDIL